MMVTLDATWLSVPMRDSLSETYLRPAPDLNGRLRRRPAMLAGPPADPPIHRQQPKHGRIELRGGRTIAVVHIDAEIPWRIDRADSEHWVGICNPLGLTV